MTSPDPTSVQWDDPRVLASPSPRITRDYLMALARVKRGLPARGRGRGKPPAEEQRGGLTDAQRRQFRDEAVVPLGWRWCPECNGEGVIWTMEASPDMNEHSAPCHRCEAERGIVPDLAPPPPDRVHLLVVHSYVATIDDGEWRWWFDAEWHAEVYSSALLVGALLATTNPSWWTAWT